MENQITELEKVDIIRDICKLGYSIETSKNILNTFLEEGGLSCLKKWEDEFSFFSSRKNVLDILLKHGLVI